MSADQQPMRYVTVNGTHYVRAEDIVDYLRAIAATEETDARNRLLTAAEFMKQVCQVKP